MKRLLLSLAFLLTVVSYSYAAKQEANSPSAQSVVGYGKYGTTIVPIQVDAQGKVVTSGGGGGGTPGGLDTQVQFNNAGAFGGDSGLIYNTTTKALTRTGVDIIDQINKPSAPTLALNGAGSLTGNYKYCVSYYTADGETACSSASANIAPSSQQVRVTIPTSAETVTGRKLYRTLSSATSEATGHLVAYLVTTIADNTTTTYDDNNTDTVVKAGLRPFFNTVINNRTYIKDLVGTVEVGLVGQEDTILGYQAAHNSTILTNNGLRGWQNTFIGGIAGYNITSGYRNTGVGYNSLNSIQNGYFNTGVGTWTLHGLSGGAHNAAFSHGSLENGTILDRNSAYGYYSLYSLGLKNSSYNGRIAQGALITTIADYSGTVAGTVKATTTTTHPYSTGDIVRIGGTENYDGMYTVTVIDTNNFYFTATYINNEGGLAESNFSGTLDTSDSNGSFGILDNVGNVCIGYFCAHAQGRGNYNTFVGYKARSENGSFADYIKHSGCIGADCQVNIDNAFVIGSDKNASSNYYSLMNVGVGVRRPIYEFTLNGTKQDTTIGNARNITAAGAAGKALSIRAGGATVNGSISALASTPTAGGTGYDIGDTLTISTGGTGATVRVAEVDAGVVKLVQLLNEGAGYTTGTGKSTTGGSGSGCTVNISTVRASTDLAGGDLNLYSGIGVGTGSSAIHLFTNPAGSTGTTDTTPTERATITASGNFGIGNTSPNGALVVNHPAAQTIAAGNIIADDACGTVKAITSSGAVTTDTTNTFTAPAAGNKGCCMDVINVGANNITLDNNANFVSFGAADVVLTPNDAVRVCEYNGASGKWYQTGLLVGN